MSTTGTDSERELFDRLWNEGWAAFRVAGSGTTPKPSADIVAMKGDRVIVFEVKKTREACVDIHKDKPQLEEIVSRSDVVEAYYAITKTHNFKWYAAPWDINKGYVELVRDTETMYKVLGEE